jgi:hypothetical protein
MVDFVLSLCLCAFGVLYYLWENMKIVFNKVHTSALFIVVVQCISILLIEIARYFLMNLYHDMGVFNQLIKITRISFFISSPLMMMIIVLITTVLIFSITRSNNLELKKIVFMVIYYLWILFMIYVLTTLCFPFFYSINIAPTIGIIIENR